MHNNIHIYIYLIEYIYIINIYIIYNIYIENVIKIKPLK